jgi:[CysO sulfur-carrier protein]-S-L-cysteine hydrolase
MRIRLSADQTQKLLATLGPAGARETGGQLYGEQLAPSDFRVTHLTVQARPGTVSRFVVDLMQAARDAIAFFHRTRHSYRRYNYIGEWHSHPSFAVLPSETDLATMRNLVRDPRFAGNFAVLMIAKLDGAALSAAAWVFDPSGETAATLEVEVDERR